MIYDWSKAPKMATHGAMNENGTAYWIFTLFGENLIHNMFSDFGNCYTWGVGPGHFMDWTEMPKDCILEKPADWTKSLEARP